jgi:CRP-like cAMP-binding protein
MRTKDMPEAQEQFAQNNLLAALAKPDLELLKSKLEWTDLRFGNVLYEAHKPVEYAYFPISGICSVIALNAHGVKIETGLIGREGFVGIHIIHHVDSAPSQVVVQAGGRALRITRTKLLNAISKSQTLSAKLLRYAHTFNVQVSQTALSNGHFTINQRLARWLLMCQDRVDLNEFPMTHKFLAIMLAVRRAGITNSLNFLEGKKAIRALRGRIVILNRACLEEIANGAYGVPEKEYKRLIP